MRALLTDPGVSELRSIMWPKVAGYPSLTDRHNILQIGLLGPLKKITTLSSQSAWRAN
jgi:hypothetical protein